MNARRSYELPRSSDPLADARRLRPMIEAQAAGAERNGRLNDEVVDALVEAGIMTLMVPASLGGGEAAPSVQLDVVEELAYADGSTGWAVMASMTAMGTFMSVLSDAGVDTVLGSENYICAGAVAPPGRARPVEGGYLISGHFSFGSGAAHAGWLIGGYAVTGDDGQGVTNPDGSPQVLFALVPRAQANLLGNWDVIGLVATASYDYEVPEQFVSHDFIAPGGSAVRGGALYAMGLKSLPGTGHAGVVLGIARRALYEFRALAQEKKRPPSGLLSKHAVIQQDFARWTAKFRAARAFAQDAYTLLFEATKDGLPTDASMKADCRLATTHAAYTAAEITQGLYLASGSEGLRNGSVLQRCFRDAHAASQHLFTGSQIYIEAGRIYLATPGLTPAHTELMTNTVTPPLT
jgi:alkylation response protein AidB-like acyl-CoA dehydrogenase